MTPWPPLLLAPPEVDVPAGWLETVTVAQVVAVVVLVTGIAAFMMRVVRPLMDFLRDWNGRPARPGGQPVPGIPDRISAIERHIADAPTRHDLDVLERREDAEHESMRASIQRIGARVGDLERREAARHDVEHARRTAPGEEIGQ